MATHRLRHIAQLEVLSKYNATQLKNATQLNDNDNDNDSIKSPELGEQVVVLPVKRNGNGDENETVPGILIDGWEIRTATSTIGNEGEMDALTSIAEKLSDNPEDGDGVVGGVGGKSKRRLCLPEIVFIDAFISLKCSIPAAGNSDTNAQSPSSKDDTFELFFSAHDAICEWAECHAHFTDAGLLPDDPDRVSTNNHRGVSIIKSADAKLWSERQERQQRQAAARGAVPSPSIVATTIRSRTRTRTKPSSSTSTSSITTTAPNNPGKKDLIEAAAASTKHCSTEFNYDWTFSTPYVGAIRMRSSPLPSDGADSKPATMTTTSPPPPPRRTWNPSASSGLDLSLLTDQSQPILYFDDVTLYEDDMHDNGYVSLRCKLRVMPTCFFLLMTLFVRVDHVLVRVRETRIFSKFDDGTTTKKKKKKGGGGGGRRQRRVYRDVVWKECKWDDLANYGLPSQVKVWRIEDEEASGGGKVQQRIHGMLKRIPQVTMPQDLPSYSFMDV